MLENLSKNPVKNKRLTKGKTQKPNWAIFGLFCFVIEYYVFV